MNQIEKVDWKNIKMLLETWSISSVFQQCVTMEECERNPLPSIRSLPIVAMGTFRKRIRTFHMDNGMNRDLFYGFRNCQCFSAIRTCLELDGLHHPPADMIATLDAMEELLQGILKEVVISEDLFKEIASASIRAEQLIRINLVQSVMEAHRNGMSINAIMGGLQLIEGGDSLMVPKPFDPKSFIIEQNKN